MKRLLSLIFVIAGLNCTGQDTARKCPIGEKFIRGLHSSGMYIADGCYPDSIAKKLMIAFFKELCIGESGLYVTDYKTSYSSNPKWINDSVGCVTTFHWRKVNNKGKWVEITEAEYNHIRKTKP